MLGLQESGGKIFAFSLDMLFTNFRSVINEHLPRFVIEIRRTDGSNFPPKTLYQMFLNMQLMVKDLNLPFNLLTDKEFEKTRRFLDDRMKQLTANGYQPVKKRAAIITDEMEQELWNNDILGSSNPKQLLWTVYFIVGKRFALRSRREHRNLRFGSESQIKVIGMSPHEKVVYNETLSKPNPSGFRNVKPEQKSMEIMATNTNHCPVEIIKFYISKVPAGSKAFYCKPNPKFHPGCSVWYWNQPMGEKKLYEIVKNISIDAGWDQNLLWSGHSLRASAITSLADKNFPDSSIQRLSGHRSVQALNIYKRSNELHESISNALANPILTFQHASTDIIAGTSKNRVSNSAILTTSDDRSRKRKPNDDYDWSDDDFNRELVIAADKAEKTAEAKNLIDKINIKSCKTVNIHININ